MSSDAGPVKIPPSGWLMGSSAALTRTTHHRRRLKKSASSALVWGLRPTQPLFVGGLTYVVLRPRLRKHPGESGLVRRSHPLCRWCNGFDRFVGANTKWCVLHHQIRQHRDGDNYQQQCGVRAFERCGTARLSLLHFRMEEDERWKEVLRNRRRG